MHQDKYGKTDYASKDLEQLLFNKKSAALTFF